MDPEQSLPAPILGAGGLSFVCIVYLISGSQDTSALGAVPGAAQALSCARLVCLLRALSCGAGCRAILLHSSHSVSYDMRCCAHGKAKAEPHHCTWRKIRPQEKTQQCIIRSVDVDVVHRCFEEQAAAAESRSLPHARSVDSAAAGSQPAACRSLGGPCNLQDGLRVLVDELSSQHLRAERVLSLRDSVITKAGFGRFVYDGLKAKAARGSS